MQKFFQLLKRGNIKVEEDRYKLSHLDGFNGGTICFPLGVCKNSQTNPFILALYTDIRTLVTDLFSARYVYYLLTLNEDLPKDESRSVETLKEEYESMVSRGDVSTDEIATMGTIVHSWINIFKKANHLFAKDDVVEEKWEIESQEIYRVFLEQLGECGYEIDKNNVNKIKQKQSQPRVQKQIFSISEDYSSGFKGGTSLSIEKF